jgi:hypothetical protein
VRFQVLTVASMMFRAVFWVILPSLMMEAVRTSETSVEVLSNLFGLKEHELTNEKKLHEHVFLCRPVVRIGTVNWTRRARLHIWRKLKFYPNDDGGIKSLRNGGNHLQGYTPLQTHKVTVKIRKSGKRNRSIWETISTDRWKNRLVSK